jgi:hypothetical protein
VLREAMASYVQLATGLTEVTRRRAVATARGLLTSSGADTVVPGALGQVGVLADEIMATSKANRALLVGLVRAEVDRAVTRLGLATHDEVASLQRSVDRLTARLDQESGPEPKPRKATPRKATPRKPATRKPAAAKTTPRKAAPPSEATPAQPATPDEESS